MRSDQKEYDIGKAGDEWANGAMKIVSFRDVHRDRVRCSDQPLYRSMIFLREAYWVTVHSGNRPYGRACYGGMVNGRITSCVAHFNTLIFNRQIASYEKNQMFQQAICFYILCSFSMNSRSKLLWNQFFMKRFRYFGNMINTVCTVSKILFLWSIEIKLGVVQIINFL